MLISLHMRDTSLVTISHTRAGWQEGGRERKESWGAVGQQAEVTCGLRRHRAVHPYGVSEGLEGSAKGLKEPLKTSGANHWRRVSLQPAEAADARPAFVRTGRLRLVPGALLSSGPATGPWRVAVV
jgi:hypothetical protein